jgi:hypothetical protein
MGCNYVKGGDQNRSTTMQAAKTHLTCFSTVCAAIVFQAGVQKATEAPSLSETSDPNLVKRNLLCKEKLLAFCNEVKNRGTYGSE